MRPLTSHSPVIPRRALVSAVALTAIAVGITTASADPTPSAGVVTSTAGLVATGSFMNANGQNFTVTFVDPEGSVAGSPSVSGADFTKPWASISVSAPGAAFGAGTMQACSNTTNPQIWSRGTIVNAPANYGGPAELPRSGISLDIACDDGSGYQTYRVTFADETFNGQPASVFDASYSGDVETYYWGSPVQNSGDHGTVATVDQGVEGAVVTICGVGAGGQTCLVPPASANFQGGGVAQIQPAPSLVTTSAG